MKYHKFRFGIKGNFKVLLCRIFGHRINDNSGNHWCNRCRLAYEECYYPKDYYIESGMIKLTDDELHDYAVKQIVYELKKMPKRPKRMI